MELFCDCRSKIYSLVFALRKLRQDDLLLPDGEAPYFKTV